MAGAGVYTYQLVRALARLIRSHQLVVFARAGLFDDLAADVHVVHIDAPSRAGRLAWEQTVLPVLLRRLRIDVLHSPHHHTPLIAPGVRRVVTFHDLAFLLLPQRYPLQRRLYMGGVTRASAWVADAIITPTEAVRKDVIARLGVPGERVVAIPEAAGPQYSPVDEETVGRVRWRYHLPDCYVLSVGSLEPGKNRSGLMRAFADLLESGIACELVIAGQAAWLYEGEPELARRLNLNEHVRYLGYVPDEDLPSLYAGARVLACPSLHEGFGLPVLEAMACGTPVVASNAPAIVEVAGDAALLVAPRDTAGLAEALRLVVSDETLRDDLRRRGLERAAEYSWERTARDTLAVYETVAAQR